MNRPPRSKVGGWCNPKTLPKGPRGFNLCRQCGTECPTRRHTFCSADCVAAWKILTQPGFARRKVYERDHGKCAACGATDDRLRGNWDADHILAVVDGGGQASLDGLQSLCRPCHRIKTAALARRRADDRKRAKGHPLL